MFKDIIHGLKLLQGWFGLELGKVLSWKGLSGTPQGSGGAPSLQVSQKHLEQGELRVGLDDLKGFFSTLTTQFYA